MQRELILSGLNTGIEPYNVLRFNATEAYIPLPKDFDLYIPEYAINEEEFKLHLEQNTMWGKYCVSALRTWNQEQTIAFQVANACLGIVGELAELSKTNEDIFGELGDVAYYRTILCYLYGMDLNLRKMHTHADEMQAISLLADVGKKSAFHYKIVADKTLQRLILGVQIIDTIILSYLEQNFLEIEEVLLFNIAKLSDRHNGGIFNPNYT